MDNQDPKVGPFVLAPHEKFVTCPYDPSHRIRDVKMMTHIAKCKKQHLKKCIETGCDVSFLYCRFNYTHQIAPEELLLHEEVCPDRYNNARFAYLLQEDDIDDIIATPPTPAEKDEELRRLREERAQIGHDASGRTWYAYDSGAPSMITAESGSMENCSLSGEMEEAGGACSEIGSEDLMDWDSNRGSLMDKTRSSMESGMNGSVGGSGIASFGASSSCSIYSSLNMEPSGSGSASASMSSLAVEMYTRGSGTLARQKRTPGGNYPSAQRKVYSSDSSMSILNGYKSWTDDEDGESASSVQTGSSRGFQRSAEDGQDGGAVGGNVNNELEPIEEVVEDLDEEWVLASEPWVRIPAPTASTSYYPKTKMTKSEKKKYRAKVAKEFKEYLAKLKASGGAEAESVGEPFNPDTFVDPSILYDLKMEREGNPLDILRPRARPDGRTAEDLWNDFKNGRGKTGDY